MTERKQTQSYRAIRNTKEISKASSFELIREEPLLIRIDERPYSVIMRTPGEEIVQAAGFCLGEGIANSPDDFETFGYDEACDPNVIDVWLKKERQLKIKDRLERRFFVSQTSCGICGKELIKDLHQILTPVENDFKINISDAFYCLTMLTEKQKHYVTTRGSHASLIFDSQLNIIAFAEDVGRHNALDKAIGKAFLNKTLSKARIVVMSSRISYELIQKGVRARIPLMLSHSRPTSLAAELGKSLNITLAFPDNETDLVIVCSDFRIN